MDVWDKSDESVAEDAVPGEMVGEELSGGEVADEAETPVLAVPLTEDVVPERLLFMVHTRVSSRLILRLKASGTGVRRPSSWFHKTRWLDPPRGYAPCWLAKNSLALRAMPPVGVENGH